MLILASTSSTRRQMLQNAGVDVKAMPSPFDEQRAHGENRNKPAPELATFLALRKAQALSELFPETIVLGSDQTMNLAGNVMHKPKDLESAKNQLMKLRGKSHELHVAIALTRGDKILFEHSDSAQLRVRNFSEEFIDDYLARISPNVLGSVGCYQIENLGVQLFDRIEGDHFTILGLPLLPLLAFLREIGELPT
jgi:septum formation protein